jgi:integrase/recombinase XerD
VLSEDEVDALFEAADSLDGVAGYRARALLELLYAGGLRVSELVSPCRWRPLRGLKA